MLKHRGLAALFLGALSLAAGAQTLPPTAGWIPQDAVIAVQASRPKALLDLLTGSDMTATVTSLPFWRELTSQPKFKEFLGGIKFLETSLETDWRTCLAELTGGGVTLAVCPNDRVVVIVDAEEDRILGRLHDMALAIAKGNAEKAGHPEQVVSKDSGGVTIWTFNGKEYHALIGRRLVFANTAEGLKEVLDLRGSTADKGLAANPAFQAASRAAGQGAAATAFVNLKSLMALPQVAGFFNQQGENPLAGLALAGTGESIRRSNWLALRLDVEDKTMAVRALAEASPAGPMATILPQGPGEGAWPSLSVPRRIASLSVYRDLRRFYAAKDELFPQRTSGLIFFENMMGIFFTGRDLTTEVLAQAGPEIRLVVAEQQYDPAIGTPQVQIPAFAAVLRMREPNSFRPVMEEAWQKAIGLVNFTRGQQALPGLIIDRPAYAGTPFTAAAFSAADVKDRTRLEQRFNFRPSLAMPGQYLILSSTDGLARDLIDSLARDKDVPVKPLAQTHSLLELDGASLASVLRANREALVHDDMVKKGKTQAESETGINILISLVGLVDRVTLTCGTRDGLTDALLKMRLRLQRP
jgi:hypothetical protein